MGGWVWVLLFFEWLGLGFVGGGFGLICFGWILGLDLVFLCGGFGFVWLVVL